jgi:hypothetical protein
MWLSKYQSTNVYGGMMAGVTGYAQPLRAIGQALEILNLEQFEMEPVGDDFFVHGSVRLISENASTSQCSPDELLAIWGTLPTAGDDIRGEFHSDSQGMLSPIELHYTAGDIERLEKAGRARRGKSEKAADASSLSQVLRCIGGYLSQKRARLLKISRDSDTVAIEYETSMGSQLKETLAVKDLYDLWVRMYLQREGRTAH